MAKLSTIYAASWDNINNIADLQNWLTGQALAGADMATLLQGFCERLRHLGIAIERGHISSATLDPNIEAISFSWRSDCGIYYNEAYLHQEPSLDWRQSPLAYVLENKLQELHCPLLPKSEPDFPAFDDFRAQGFTDYYITAFGYGWFTHFMETHGIGELGMVSSWATAEAGGFGQQLAVLKQLLPTFALAVKVAMMQQITHTMFATYLGADAAKRVLQGEVRRGTAQSINAAIFFADLQGFTGLADAIDPHVLVDMLNHYLDDIATPVEQHGGQVLKFMGDGLLATFASADAALAATVAVRQNIEDFNRSRRVLQQPVMELDIALHLGEVLYGNVGASTRLDFTVIGPAVNEAARMEALCDQLDVHLVISQAFQAQLSDNTMICLGEHYLRGVREPRMLYTL